MIFNIYIDFHKTESRGMVPVIYVFFFFLIFNVHTTFNLLNCSIDWQNETFILHCYQFSVPVSTFTKWGKPDFLAQHIEMIFSWKCDSILIIHCHFILPATRNRTEMYTTIYHSLHSYFYRLNRILSFCAPFPFRPFFTTYLGVQNVCMVTVQWTRMCVYVAMNDER